MLSSYQITSCLPACSNSSLYSTSSTYVIINRTDSYTRMAVYCSLT